MKRIKIRTYEGIEFGGETKAQYKEFIINLFNRQIDKRKLVYTKKFNHTIITVYI